MHNIPLSRPLLHQRHRLSHQQIDELLNETYSKEDPSEKYGQLFQVGEFIKLTDEFREADIPVIPLKGPILSYRLHKDSSYRYSNDLDFLVSIDAVKNAISILEKNGYQPAYFPWPEKSKKERRLIRLTNQLLFVHPEKHLSIEMHWKLFSYEITNSGVLSKILKSNGSQVEFKGRNFPVFSDELELLYLIIHGGLHAWFRLKWLIDIKDFIEKVPYDPEKFNQLVRKFNASRMVSLCNSLLSKYFPECPVLPGKSVPETNKRLKFTISQIEQEEMYYDKSFPERSKSYGFLMNCFPGFKFKLSVLGVIFYSNI